jgi:alkyl hydroperoxide reductase subunit AhpC
MVELGELEKRHEDLEKRQVRVVVISNDDQPTAQATQADFPHLVVVADAEQKLAKAVQVLHPEAGRHHDTTNAPTTILVDGTGKVRWLFRPERIIARLSPDELLAAIDATWPS